MQEVIWHYLYLLWSLPTQRSTAKCVIYWGTAFHFQLDKQTGPSGGNASLSILMTYIYCTVWVGCWSEVEVVGGNKLQWMTNACGGSTFVRDESRSSLQEVSQGERPAMANRSTLQRTTHAVSRCLYPTLSTHTSIHPSIRSYIHLFKRPSICSCVHLYIHPSIHTFIHPSIHTFIHPSVHTFVYTYVHPSICSSIHPSICSYIHMFKRPSICS